MTESRSSKGWSMGWRTEASSASRWSGSSAAEAHEVAATGFQKHWHRFEVFLDELDLTPKLTVPKEAHIDNPRLVVFNVLLLTSALACMCYYYYTELPHMKAIPYATTAWVHMDFDSLRNASAWTLTPDQSVCKSPKATCVPACGLSVIHSGCRPVIETFEQIDSSSVFIPVSARPAVTQGNGSQSQQNDQTQIFYFVERLKFFLTHEAISEGGPSLPLAAAVLESNSEKSAVTVFLDAEDRVWQVIPPGHPIRFGMSDAPRLLAGLPHEGSANFDAFLRRIVLNGGYVAAAVDCYNFPLDAVSQSHGLTPAMLAGMEFEHVCLARLKFRQKELGPALRFHETSRTATDSMVEIKAGLLLRGSDGAGFGRYEDVESFLLALTTAFVFLQLPNKFLRVFVMVCLGHLSLIYRRLIRERFILEKHAGDLTAEVLSHKSCFDILAAEDGVPETISYKTMRRHLTDIINDCDGCLSADEVEHLLQFSLDSASGNQRSTLRQEAKDMLRKQFSMESIPLEPCPMPRRVFMESVSGRNKTIDLKLLLGLFARNRKVAFFEFLFTPARLYKTVHSKTLEPDSEGAVLPDVGEETIVIEEDDQPVVSKGCSNGEPADADVIKAEADEVPRERSAPEGSEQVWQRLEEQAAQMSQLERTLEVLARQQEAQAEKLDRILQSTPQLQLDPGVAPSAAVAAVDASQSEVKKLAEEMENLRARIQGPWLQQCIESESLKATAACLRSSEAALAQVLSLYSARFNNSLASFEGKLAELEMVKAALGPSPVGPMQSLASTKPASRQSSSPQQELSRETSSQEGMPQATPRMAVTQSGLITPRGIVSPRSSEPPRSTATGGTYSMQPRS